MNFKLSAPCGNCPFLKRGAIELHPGRLDEIIASLLADDHVVFHCHKTTQDGEWIEDEDGNEHFQSSGNESHCAGAMIYLLKACSQNIAMRLAAGFGLVSFDELMQHADKVIDR